MILLKKCARVATLNDSFDEFTDVDILIEGNKIKEIGANIAIHDNSKVEVLDCTGCVAVPGLVNTHHHLYQTLTRNLPGAQDAKLFDWLVYLYPIWAQLDEEAVFLSTMLGCVELLKTGCTCTTDHMYLYPRNFAGDIMETQFRAAEKVGIRFAPSRGSMTRGKSSGGLPPDDVVQTTEAVVSDMIRVIEKFDDRSPLSMRRIILAPCSPFSVEASVMVETAKIAREFGVPLHTHLVETLDEEEYCIEKYGKRPLAAMRDWGWLGDDVYFAHGIWFNNDELDLLAETGTGIAHCPTSNMRLGSGIARVKEMLDKNIRVGLGVDGSASNDSSDMLGEARNAMLLQRVKYGSDALGARQVLKIASTNGAKLLGYNEIGTIEVGKGADIAIFDVSGIGYAGGQSDPVASLIFAGFDHTVKYSLVNGEIVVKDGKIVGIDEQELVAKANEASAKLLNG